MAKEKRKPIGFLPSLCLDCQWFKQLADLLAHHDMMTLAFLYRRTVTLPSVPRSVSHHDDIFAALPDGVLFLIRQQPTYQIVKLRDDVGTQDAGIGHHPHHVSPSPGARIVDDSVVSLLQNLLQRLDRMLITVVGLQQFSQFTSSCFLPG